MHQKKSQFLLFDIPFSTLNLENTLSMFQQKKEIKEGYVCFVNVHSLTESLKNPSLKEALAQATLCTPDGLPIVWTSKLLASQKNKIESRVCGPDFMKNYLEQNPNETFGFIGSTTETIQKIITKYSLKKTVVYSPPYEPYSKNLAIKTWTYFQKLCDEQDLFPSIIWVGLGAPKQEQWMYEVQKSFHPKNTVFFGVGAAFDFMAGEKTRAPVLLQRLGLEWLYRLGQEPKRLFQRYLVSNSRFLWNVLFSSPSIVKTNHKYKT